MAIVTSTLLLDGSLLNRSESVVTCPTGQLLCVVLLLPIPHPILSLPSLNAIIPRRIWSGDIDETQKSPIRREHSFVQSTQPYWWMQPFDSTANTVIYSYGPNQYIRGGDAWVEMCRLPGAARGLLGRQSSWWNMDSSCL